MAKTSIKSGEAQCPNCAAPINIPKSTRSIICHTCDAILKVVEQEDGVVLKVVGRSVAENPSYQQLEAQVEEVKAHLADLHREYEELMNVPLPGGALRLALLGVAVAVAGLVTLVFAPLAGAVALAAGVVLAVAGFAARASRKRAKLEAGARLSKTIEQVGAQRDMLQRKAARLKTEV